jgi:hypothetical protein
MKLHPYSFEELNNKTVEYQIQGRGTHYGRLHPKVLENGSIEPTIQIEFSGDPKPPEPHTLDPRHLRMHPIPARAEYLWAEDADHIVALIRSNLGIK